MRSIERKRKATPGAVCSDTRHQARHHRYLDRIGETDPKCPLGGCRIEVLAMKHRRLYLGEGDAHGIGQGKRAGRWPHAFGAARQQLVAEQRPEPREIVAHGRLTEPDPGGRPRDAPLGEQRIERDQQVQVEPT